MNPCCIPLKSGIQIITHLSMALAVAVCCMGIRLITISSEVKTNPLFQQQFEFQSEKLPDENELLWNFYLKGISEGSIKSPEGSDHGKMFLQTLRNFSPKAPVDFDEYAKVSLVCGLMAICAVFFQFLTSFILLCFINRDDKASSQIWVAVNCSVIFCLATCLVLFLCEGTSIPIYSFDETLFLLLITVDTLLSIYFLWVVMAFI